MKKNGFSKHFLELSSLGVYGVLGSNSYRGWKVKKLLSSQ
jgi:hypothetical protein